jgi:predicted transcriptional regulator
MISKSILFYWSKGSDIRRKILIMINQHCGENKPCFLNLIAKKLKMSHVGVKKHLDLMVEERYIKLINPKGKPVYLQLSEKGKGVIKELNKN